MSAVSGPRRSCSISSSRAPRSTRVCATAVCPRRTCSSTIVASSTLGLWPVDSCGCSSRIQHLKLMYNSMWCYNQQPGSSLQVLQDGAHNKEERKGKEDEKEC